MAGLCTVLDVVGPIVTNGWYPDPDDSLGGLQLLARVFNEEADREDDGPVGAASDSGDVTRTADDLMSEKTRDKLDDIEADLCTAFPSRSPILREAFEAHRQARFNLSVPVLIAQADGIWHDRCKKSVFTSRRKSAVREMLKRPNAHTAAPLAKALLGGDWPLALRQDERKRKPDFSQLNRHQVLHGEATDYGTEVNSLKAISFIRFEAHRQARFNLSVPVLIAQADGIWHDRCKKSVFTSRRKSAVREMLKRPNAHTAAPLAKALLGGDWPLALRQDERKRKPDFSQLNRHQVLHGEATDYGTEVNSLKAISFIRFCGFVLSDMTEDTEAGTSLRAA